MKGRVVDPEGKPVAGAIVTVGQYHSAVLGWIGNQFADRREVDRAISDRQGHFSVSFEDIDPGSPKGSEVSDRWSMPKVVAWAPGFGPAFPETFARDVTEDKPIPLVRDDVPITGRVVDLEGRPVSGGNSAPTEGDSTVGAIFTRCRTDTSASSGGAPSAKRIRNAAFHEFTRLVAERQSRSCESNRSRIEFASQEEAGDPGDHHRHRPHDLSTEQARRAPRSRWFFCQRACIQG